MRSHLTLVALLLSGCAGESPLVPEGAVPLTPPTIYMEWWDEVEGELGSGRDESRVRWFVVRGGLFPSRDGEPTSGRWIPDGRIYLAEGWELDENTVKHEMLHELLRGDYEHSHPLFQKYDAQSCFDNFLNLIPCPPDNSRLLPFAGTP